MAEVVVAVTAVVSMTDHESVVIEVAEEAVADVVGEVPAADEAVDSVEEEIVTEEEIAMQEETGGDKRLPGEKSFRNIRRLNF